MATSNQSLIAIRPSSLLDVAGAIQRVSLIQGMVDAKRPPRVILSAIGGAEGFEVTLTGPGFDNHTTVNRCRRWLRSQKACRAKRDD
jgi:hypothetical protein